MNYLDAIVERKRRTLPQLRAYAAALPPRKRSRHSLRDRMLSDPCLSVIAEIKRASPSLGAFAPDLDILNQAALYDQGGASAISVLTDTHFCGTLLDLEAVARQTSLPVLAKDFILDPAQIDAADALGADLILLIAAVLGAEEIESLARHALTLGMEVLLELHAPEEITKIPAGLPLMLGINNRDLKTFEVSVENGLKVMDRLPPGEAPVIMESGIRNPETARKAASAGFSGLLVGESLLRTGRPAELLRSLSTVPKEVRP